MPASSRLLLPDVIRGLALFGIFQYNLLHWILYAEPGYVLLWIDQSTIGRWVYLLIAFIVSAKFYPIYAMLFGYGFHLQWRGLKKKYIDPEVIMIRRYIFLLLLGVVHGLFLFYGDILTTYAVGGLVLLLAGFGHMRTRAIRSLMPRVLLCNLILAGFYCVAGYDAEGPGENAPSISAIESQHVQTAVGVVAAAGESYTTGAIIRAHEYAESQVFGAIFFIPQIFLFFMIGICAARAGLLERPGLHHKLWQKILYGSLMLSIPLSILFCVCELMLGSATEPLPLIRMLESGLNDCQWLLSPAWIAIIVLAVRKLQLKILSLLQSLAAAGRLALTHYLAQSFFMLFILSGTGLGWGIHPGIAGLSIIAAALWLIQVAISRPLLNIYGIGPVEWVWRCFTYGRSAKAGE